jgi:hypothetical protein
VIRNTDERKLKTGRRSSRVSAEYSEMFSVKVQLISPMSLEKTNSMEQRPS